jgi:hypothetical protein
MAARFASQIEARGWPNYTFAFHASDEVGPALLAQIGNKTALRPKDL